jgi:feruloyl esterase
VVVGKQITESFYGKPHTKSYYLGCSTGGRQGFKSAQDFPEDFDGIVAGAPAIAFNNLSAWSGHFLPITGTASDPQFVPTQLWPVIHQDILNQCDALDGYVDGVLEDPMLCNYTSTNLICSANLTANCLTELQSKTVREIFSPLINTNDGSIIYPRMQPGSEIIASYVIYTGTVFPYTLDYFRYMLYNDPAWDATTISNADYENAYRTNPQDIHTFKGDLSAVRDRGAKILHWHGLMDGIISSDNSPPYYEHVSQTMGLEPAQLDEFYRFFRMSGTGHCSGGDGAHVFGQAKGSAASDSPSENVLMAIVDWVENGNAPESVIGTRYVNDTAAAGVDYKRAHCKWPSRNVYKGNGDPKAVNSWECVGL